MGAITRGIANNILGNGAVDATDALTGTIPATNIGNPSLANLTTFPPSVSAGIPEVAGDPPAPSDGDVWYNTVTYKLRVRGASVPTGSWATGGSLNTTRYEFQGVGSQTAGLFVGGNTPGGYKGETETYDGTSFTEVGDLNTATRNFGAAGTTTSAVIWGGQADQDMTETWNGTSWTSAAAIPGSRYGACTSIGSDNTSAIAAGGDNGSNNTFEWNGTSWTALPNMNVTRELGAGVGTVSSSIVYGGAPNVVNAETWNGSSWTETGDLNIGRRLLGGAGGSVNTALAIAGDNSADSDTELFNGSTWSELADLSNSMGGGTAAAGSSSFAAMAVQNANTEEFTAGNVNLDVDLA